MSHYLTSREAAVYVGAKSVKSFNAWVNRHGVPSVRYGNRRRFTAEQLDRVLRTMALRKAG